MPYMDGMGIGDGRLHKDGGDYNKPIYKDPYL